jgi:hypothetical protein
MRAPPLKLQLVLQANGLWEASVVLRGEVLNLGYFAERAEAERALDLAMTHYGPAARGPDPGKGED